MQQIIITSIPILIGSGMPLFGLLTHNIRLRHVETRQFAHGLVQSTYAFAG
jgi:dihydrofolate reductase